MTQNPDYVEFHGALVLRSAIVGIGVESQGQGILTKHVVIYTIGGPIRLPGHSNDQSLQKAREEAIRKWTGPHA